MDCLLRLRLALQETTKLSFSVAVPFSIAARDEQELPAAPHPCEQLAVQFCSMAI